MHQQSYDVVIGSLRKPWSEDSPKWALCAKETSSDAKNIITKDLASEEAAKRYYSTKEFVYKGKKVFSIKDIRPDTKFLDQDAPAQWIIRYFIPAH